MRKRSAREVENARQFGVERLAGDLLAVVDSLEMGLEAGASASAEALLRGQRSDAAPVDSRRWKKWREVLNPEGEPFDPQLHEAMTTPALGHRRAGSDADRGPEGLPRSMAACCGRHG